MRSTVIALLAAVALAAPVSAARNEPPEALMARLLAGREAGTPTQCISLPRSGDSRIIPGTAILYREGGTWWVNRPRTGAESLRDDDILVSSSTLAQRCRLDTVTLIDRASRIQHGFVVLGDFVPYRLPPKRR